MPCFRLASWRDLPNKFERKSWERIERVRALERIESSPLLIYKNRQRACRILCPARSNTGTLPFSQLSPWNRFPKTHVSNRVSHRGRRRGDSSFFRRFFQTFLSISFPSAFARKFSREIEHTFYRGTKRIGSRKTLFPPFRFEFSKRDPR